MEMLFPFLEVTSPDGQQFRVELIRDQVTIGRSDLFNDVALEPDPQHLISRKVHCALERDTDGWQVLHNGGVNPTFVQRSSGVEMVEGRTRLKHGESILLLGRLTDAGELRYWTICLMDPLETKPAGQLPRVATLTYDWIEARLFRIEGPERQEIRDLRRQEHLLVRYMEGRNRANDHVAVFCTSEELITAVWGDEDPTHTETELAHVIYELRQKLEPNPREPRFLETVRGMGYRLVTRPFRKEGR